MKRSEPARVYQRLRQKFGGYSRPVDRVLAEGESVPYGDNRDPGTFAHAVELLTDSMGWNANIAQAELVENWSDIVGDDVAAHTSPTGCSDAVLEVHCDSSAWATQLRLMRSDLVAALSEKFPEAGIQEISVKAPGAPSWKHGRRSVPGRGPRDTYG